MSYNVYPGVRKLQEFLQSKLDDASITGPALKETDGSYDGKYGPDTDGAFWAWLSNQPSGTDMRTLVAAGVLSTDDYAQVTRAQAEFSAVSGGGAGGDADPAPGAEPEIPPIPKAAWSTTTWVLLGAGIATALAGAYWWYQNRRKQRKYLPSHAGLDGLGGGCGCGG